MNMSKSRDIQAKMLSPKVIFYAFWLATVKVLNSYEQKVKKKLQSCKKADGYRKRTKR
mgnify:CR=1 FL=1